MRSLIVVAAKHQQDMERLNSIMKKEFQTMLPQVMEVTESFNIWDVSKTVESSCWKLFRDSDVDRNHRFLRSRGAMILGEEFATVAADWKTSEEEGDQLTSKLEHALDVAKNKSKGSDLSKRDEEEYQDYED